MDRGEGRGDQFESHYENSRLVKGLGVRRQSVGLLQAPSSLTLCGRLPMCPNTGIPSRKIA